MTVRIHINDIISHTAVHACSLSLKSTTSKLASVVDVVSSSAIAATTTNFKVSTMKFSTTNSQEDINQKTLLTLVPGLLGGVIVVTLATVILTLLIFILFKKQRGIIVINIVRNPCLYRMREILLMIITFHYTEYQTSNQNDNHAYEDVPLERSVCTTGKRKHKDFIIL